MYLKTLYTTYKYQLLQIRVSPKESYRVTHMDKVDFEELLWLCFGVRHVYILISGIIFFQKFQMFGPSSYDLAHFSNFQPNPNFKNEPNHRGEPLKKYSSSLKFTLSIWDICILLYLCIYIA